LRPSEKPAALAPGLAKEWAVNPSDRTRWTVKLRPAVKFHDGSDFNADAVVWNIEKLLNDKRPITTRADSAQIRTRLRLPRGLEKIDDNTVELQTRVEDAFFPYQLTFLLISSPAQFENVGRDWQAFAARAVRTGPFKLERLVSRQRAELVANASYCGPEPAPQGEPARALADP
jgi:peptide/nickel transport system substrate-binding protein